MSQKTKTTYLVLGRTQGQFGVRDFWRVCCLALGDQRVSKFSFSRFGSDYGKFLAQQVGSSGFLMGSNAFEQTWVCVSLKLDLSSSKQFKICYIWVQSNTSS